MSIDNHLKNLIQHNGPISIAQFMAEALANPQYGYYKKQNPFGAEGDFITSPEISQMFGELIGIWCVLAWQQMGSPNKISLIELGPGRGILMDDLLRGTKHVPGFHESIEIHMVEISTKLQNIQKKNLRKFHPNITWHESINSVPSSSSIIIANEFFDALPIYQYEKTQKGWNEKLVCIGENGEFEFKLSTEISFTDKKNTTNGAILELCPTGIEIIKDISSRILKHSGAALIIDYGYNEICHKDTLQAVKNHKYHPVLEEVGKADITAHVDFLALSRAAEESGAKALEVITQRDFLLSLGIELRKQSLMKNASKKQREKIIKSTDRLINPDEMGTLFKVLGIVSYE